MRVVVPLRGIREYSATSLASILGQQYGALVQRGDPGREMRLGLNKTACSNAPNLNFSHVPGGRLEWVFVTDSERDPVLPLLERCIADLPEEAQSRAVVLTAGKSSTTSQKIHKCADLGCL